MILVIRPIRFRLLLGRNFLATWDASGEGMKQRTDEEALVTVASVYGLR